MDKKIFSRVILLPDGKVHIVMPDGHTMEGSPRAIKEILSDPIGFVTEGRYNYVSNTLTINRKNLSIDDVGGITLLKIYSNSEIVINFPALFRALFNSPPENEEEVLNLNYYKKETQFTDEKDFWLKTFLDYQEAFRKNKLSVKRRLGLGPEDYEGLIYETFNTFFSVLAPKTKVGSRKKEQATPIEDSYITPNEYEDTLSVKEFALRENVQEASVYGWIKKNRLEGVIKTDDGFRINKSARRPQDKRAGRSMPPKSEQGTRKYGVSPNSYEAVQLYIKENQFFSDELRQYIRTAEEAKYYVNKRYHEVNWDGKPALIIDVKPEYVSKRLNKTNKELMLEGKSPVVPGNDEFEYVIHHIGQKPDSPFAIIPANDHREMDHMFHEKKSSKDGNLHDTQYYAAKAKFWGKYVEEYERAGTYNRIPYTSTKKKEKKV